MDLKTILKSVVLFIVIAKTAIQMLTINVSAKVYYFMTKKTFHVFKNLNYFFCDYLWISIFF